MSANIQLIVIGGSAGSLQPLFNILENLGADFPYPVLLVLHRTSNPDSSLDNLLAAKTGLRVKEVEEKEQIRPGCLYICPSDYHVLIEADHSFSLDASERVHFSRPSLDVVFESAAEIYGDHLLAVLLSGASMDGAEGLHAVKTRGGTTIVQCPEEAQVPYMPEQALRQAAPSHIMTSGAMGRFMADLA